LTLGAGGSLVFDPSLAGAPIEISSGTVAAAPEPDTLALLIRELALLAMYRK